MPMHQQHCTRIFLAERRIEDWLDGITDFDQRATVVALAALDGMPYDAVSRVATMLESAWREDQGGNGTPPGRVRRPRKARLQAARARITTEVRRTRYGVAELEVAAFVSAGYSGRVLEHLWREHDYDREIILNWLNAVAKDAEGRVRTRAASAIGFLARLAFDTIRRDVVVPWAGSGNGDERERASRARHARAALGQKPNSEAASWSIVRRGSIRR